MTSDCARKQKHQERTHTCERRKTLEWNRTLSRLTTVKTTAPPRCLEEEEKTFSGRRQEASLASWKDEPRVLENEFIESRAERRPAADPDKPGRSRRPSRLVAEPAKPSGPPIGRHHLTAISALCRTVAMGTVAHVAGSRQGNSSSPRLLTHFRSAMPRYR